MKDRVAIQFATWFGVGRFPKSPGTVGSLPGILVGWAIHALSVAAFDASVVRLCATTVLLLAGVYLAYWSIDRMERALGVHDDQTIVIDEVIGQAIAIAFLTPSLIAYLLAFVLFRAFDIAKPSLIGRIDRDVPGAWGTLGDDLLAGVMAGILTFVAQSSLAL